MAWRPSFQSSSAARPESMAIYHLSDEQWVVPALETFDGPASLVYHSKDESSDAADDKLGQHANLQFIPRTRGNLMHNKFLVRRENGESTSVLTGSANFTTKGLTSQANLLHTWQSKGLADVFQTRFELLSTDPMPKVSKAQAGWSDLDRGR